jgi:hypothetical protein
VSAAAHADDGRGTLLMRATQAFNAAQRAFLLEPAGRTSEALVLAMSAVRQASCLPVYISTPSAWRPQTVAAAAAVNEAIAAVRALRIAGRPVHGADEL